MRSAWLYGLVFVWVPLGASCLSSEDEVSVRCGPRVQVLDGEKGFSAQVRFTTSVRPQGGEAGTWFFTVSDPNISVHQVVRATADNQATVTATSLTPSVFTLTGTYQRAGGTLSLPASCKIIMTAPHPDSGMTLFWSRPTLQETISAGVLSFVSFQLRGRDGRPAIGRNLLLSTDTPSMVATDAAVTTDANGMASTHLLKMHPGSAHLVATASHFAHELEVLTLAGPAHPEASQIRLLRAYKTSAGKIVRTYEAKFFDHLANPQTGEGVAWSFSDESCDIVASSSTTTSGGDAEATLMCGPLATGALLAETQALSLTHPIGHEDAAFSAPHLDF